VFGALGVLCSLAWVQRRRSGIVGRRLWLPLAAGLGLIAMVGVGGPRTDLWAHLFGFFAGAAIGPLVAQRDRAGPGVQLSLLALALGIVGVAWWRALLTAG
jgi:membrane associated rhomboid family serine protease